MKIGFIGTGTMGGSMVQRLLDAGHTVTIYDRKAAAMTRLVDAGATAAASPKAAANGSEVVFTSLPGPTEVEHVLLDPEDGILASLTPGGAYIDTTTNSVTVFKRLAGVCKDRSIDVLDAPIMTGRPPNLIMFVGGDDPVFQRYRPLLECLAAHIFYMGDIGHGMVAKAANQLIGFADFFGTVEALILGAKMGMDIDSFLAAQAAGRRRGQGEGGRLARALQGEVMGYPISMMLKDAALTCELGELTSTDAPFALLVRDIIKRAEAAGFGEKPSGYMVRILEEAAGVELHTGRGATPEPPQGR